MNRRLQWTAGLVLVALSATASAQSSDYLGYKMLNTRDYPFRYYVDARAQTPAGIALTEVVAATQGAFQTWDNVSCAYPSFQYAGLTTSNSAINPSDVGNNTDAFNVSTVWVTSTSDKYYETALASGQSLSGAVPLTFAGYLYQCDIFINGVNFRWTTLPSTDPRENFHDLQSILTYEVGHCLGLADSYFPEASVMYPDFPAGGSKRVLDQSDVTKVCDYYPDNGAVGSPCSASDPCTNGLSCIPYKNSSGVTLYSYCSKSCPGVTNGECPSPFVCKSSTLISGQTHACLAVPGEAVTQVGKACNNNTDCGGARSICQPPVALPSTGVAWVDGYCQEDCTAGGTTSTCPAGSVCVELGAQDRCLKPCRPGTGDCRDGYTCSPTAQGNVCVPPCYADADCSSDNSFVCRVCDRVCVENKASGLSVGDACTKSEQCGPGQVCFFINNNPQGVCTETCNTAQCACPLGSECKSIGPDHVCMKDCASGTCSSPLQCNPVGETYSCTPACRTRSDCPTGFECDRTGECYDPLKTPDAGCTLCSGDGGPPPPPPPTDGGTSGGSGGAPSGCGCGQAPASAMVFFGVLALVLFAGRRRSW